MSTKLQTFIRGLKRLIISVIKNDFYGMAAEMGFMMVIGIFPFMLFLMAIFGWICSAFGGGGHKLAAGAVIKANPENAVKMILEEIKKQGLC